MYKINKTDIIILNFLKNIHKTKPLILIKQNENVAVYLI